MNQFKEEQKFTQLWIWLLIGGPSLVVIIPFIMQLVTGDPVGNQPGSTAILGVVSLMMIGLLFFIWSLKLRTDIDHKNVRFNYGIFGKKTIPWSSIEKAEVVNYGFVGYGLRLTIKYGTVYNVGGKWGLFLTLKNGKKITIGTQDKAGLEQFMASRNA